MESGITNLEYLNNILMKFFDMAHNRRMTFLISLQEELSISCPEYQSVPLDISNFIALEIARLRYPIGPMLKQSLTEKINNLLCLDHSIQIPLIEALLGKVTFEFWPKIIMISWNCLVAALRIPNLTVRIADPISLRSRFSIKVSMEASGVVSHNLEIANNINFLSVSNTTVVSISITRDIAPIFAQVNIFPNIIKLESTGDSLCLPILNNLTDLIIYDSNNLNISNTSTITRLYLNNYNGDVDIRHFEMLTTLDINNSTVRLTNTLPAIVKYLRIHYCTLRNSDFIFIEGLNDLFSMDLSDTDMSQFRTWELKSPSLRELNLTRCNLTDITHLIAGLPNLEVLNLSHNPILMIKENQFMNLHNLHTIIMTDSRH